VSPLRLRKNAGNQVKREKALRPTAVVIDREGNALKKKREIGQFAALSELAWRHAAEPSKDALIVRAGAALGGKHLVVKRACRIAVEQALPGETNGCCRHRETISNSEFVVVAKNACDGSKIRETVQPSFQGPVHSASPVGHRTTRVVLFLDCRPPPRSRNGLRGDQCQWSGNFGADLLEADFFIVVEMLKTRF
jgi:hypothetical protein